MCWDVKQADTCWHRASCRPAPSRPGHMYNVVPAGWSRCGNKQWSHMRMMAMCKSRTGSIYVCVLCVLVSGGFFHFNVLVCVCVCVCLWNCGGIKKPLECMCACLFATRFAMVFVCNCVYHSFKVAAAIWYLRNKSWFIRVNAQLIDISKPDLVPKC